MTQISKKAYKGLPVGIKVRKPHYYYQDFLEVFNDNAEKYVELREFEGLDYSFNRGQITFDEKVLWNGYTSPSCERLLAPYTDGDKTVYNVTTVGNLYINNGVASGFSVNNYLTISNKTISDITQFELLTKIKINDSLAADSPIVCKTDAVQDLFISKGRTLSIWDGSTYFGGSTILNTTDWYWVKTILVGNEYKAYLLKDENYTIDTLPEINEWSLEVTTTSNIWSGSILNVGRGNLSGNQFFSGSIDISQTYIKVNDEIFWQLEENIVPNVPNYLTSVRKLVYGVNGSPTIIDNVASGFSSSNYVTIDTPKFSEADTWEIFTKLIIGSDVASEQYIYQFSKTSADSGRFGIALINVSGVIGYNLSFTGSAWVSDSDFTSIVNNNYPLEANTTYYTKLSFDGNCYRLEMSKNNIDWDVAVEKYTTTKIYSGLTYTRLGSYNGKSVYFKGSIDLNESYIKLDDKIVWGKDAINVGDGVGCLDNITDVAEERTLTAFVKDDEILLSESGDDKVGYTWANKVTIPQHEVIPVYKKKFSDSSSECTYSFSENNILISYKSNGYSLLNENIYYDFIPETSFFDYDVRFTAKVTTGTSSTHRIIGRVGVWFTWSSGKLQAIDKSLVCDATLTNNTTYWVRVGESYDVATGQYIHRVCYIKDNGYTRETLPDESKWIVKTSADTTPWFKSTTRIKGLGDVDAQNKSFSWDGTIDLTNCWVDYSSVTNIGDNTRIYEIKWEMLEKV